MDVFKKNLDILAILDKKLHTKLEKLEGNNRYDVFQGSRKEDVNIVDTQENLKFYHDALEGIRSELKYFDSYSEYDFLYMYGIGNGIVVDKLLTNPKHQQIVVVEPNIELLYVALNMIDFSEALMQRRLVLLLREDLDFATISKLFLYKNADLYARVFTLHAITPYYEQVFYDEMIKTNEQLLQVLEYAVFVAGNSAVDQVLGLKQHVENIPLMLQGPKLSALKKKKNSDVAIVVATGPSLHKQLELLKEIQEHVTIFSVDASMPILEKNGIKPDFVTSMERDEISDVFHKKTSKEFQEDINFVCASLQNRCVFDAIKAGTTTLVMRPFTYNAFFGVDEYGYICSGMSAANMAYELAAVMKYKTIVFIGQDLAYGEDGASHSKEHVLGNEQISEDGGDSLDNSRYEIVELEAYGGKGTVKSIRPWKLFLSGLIHSIGLAKVDGVQSINATEGGSRIDGTIEMPFKEVVEKYVDRSFQKELIMLESTNEKEYRALKRGCDEKVEELIKEGESLQKRLEEEFLFLSEKLKRLENLDVEEAIQEFSMVEMVELLDRVNNLREELSTNDIFNEFYHDMLKSVVVSYELELAEIKVSKVTSKDENELKALRWVSGHRTWMFDIAGGIWNVVEILKNNYEMGD